MALFAWRERKEFLLTSTRSMIWLLLLVVVTLLAPLEARGDAHPPSSPHLTLTGELRGGVGADHLTLWGDQRPLTSFAEGRLALKHLPLDITATFLVRHFMSDDAYWRGKCKYVVGLYKPISRDLSVFGEFERKYHVSPDDSWVIAGVSLKFTALGGKK